jgi:hypothetical protein
VRVTNNSNVYGSAAGYFGNSSLVVAQYLNGSNVITTLTVPPTVTGTNYAYNDGAGDVFNFNLAPFTSGVSPTVVPNSNAGVTPVGAWQMGVTGLSGTTNNFSGNLVVVGVQTVTPKSVSVNAAGVSKVYDGNTSMTGLTAGLSGLLASDGVTVNGNGAFSSKNAGPNLGYTVSGLQLSGADQANYVLSGGNTLSGSDGTITPKTVTLSANKVYDGTTNLAGAVTLNTGISGESLTYSGATANSSHVATPANYINAITLQDGTGGLASNYQLPTLSNSTAPVSITAKTLTSSASIGGTLTKTYDGTTSATGATVTGSVSGAIAGDTLALDSSGVTLAYNNAHVANATTISASGSEALGIVGSSAGSVASDYSFTSPVVSSATASITAKTLSPTLTNNGVSRVYDGSTSAPVGFTPSYSYSGLVAGDTNATLDNAAAAYNSAHVANATTLTVSGLSINAITGSNGSVGSDYVLDATAKSVAASITTKALTSSASIGGTLTKVYDGSTSAASATLSGSVSGAIAGDTLILDTSALNLAYNNAHVANAIQIAAAGGAGFTIGSTSNTSVASDYSFTGPSIAAVGGSITPHSLTATLTNTPVSKVYDGSTSAPSGFVPSFSFSGLAPGDTSAQVGYTTASYNSSRVLAANQLTVSGMGIGSVVGSLGSFASDYVLAANTQAVAASITPRGISATGNAANTLSRVYDGSTSLSSTSLALGGIVAGDSVNAVVTGNFVSRNVGTPLGYSVNNITLSGTDASNYSYTGSTSFTGTQGSITPRTLVVNWSAASKVYDGNTNASITSNDNRVSGDVLGIAASGAFVDKNVGQGKTVNVAGIALSGGDATNYVLASTTASTTGNITRLDSVTSVGGGSGHVFDPAKWASGPVTTIPATAAPALVFEAASEDSRSTSGLAQGTTTGVVVEVGQASAEDQISRMIQVFVPKDAATSGTGFAFAVPEEWQKDIADYGLQATRMDGSALPAWLKWDATTLRFVASAVPDGAFPVQLRVNIGPKKAIVVIAERQQN